MGYMEDGIALVMVYEGNGVWTSNSVGLFGFSIFCLQGCNHRPVDCKHKGCSYQPNAEDAAAHSEQCGPLHEFHSQVMTGCIARVGSGILYENETHSRTRLPSKYVWEPETM